MAVKGTFGYLPEGKVMPLAKSSKATITSSVISRRYQRNQASTAGEDFSPQPA
jgi:hypothetical protein